MDARTPPSIALEDLDRDELLVLIRQAWFTIRPRDLLYARWKVAAERARAAWDDEVAAGERTTAALHAYVNLPKTTETDAQRQHAWKTYEEARVEETAFERRRRRRDRFQEGAWKALEACPARV